MKSDQQQAVAIRTAVRSIQRLESLQIIHDGRIVASRDLLTESPDPIVKAQLEVTLTPKRSGWFASRALFRAPDDLLRQAHTSPVYVSVDEKPAASAEDGRYMLRWIDHLAAIAKSQPDRFPDADAQQSVLTIYSEARSRYEQIIEDAQHHWGD